MKARFLFYVLLAFVLFGAAALADNTATWDARQQEIVRVVTDELVSRIASLKLQFPELANFPGGPGFTRTAAGFRYDYRTEKVFVIQSEAPQERPLPGGCFISFDLLPVRDTILMPPVHADLTAYASSGSSGGDRAGIAHQFTFGLPMASDQKQDLYATHRDAALAQALNEDVEKVCDTTFSRLTSEYLLAQNGIGLDVASLLATAKRPETQGEDPAETLSYNSLVLLRFHRLTPDQWLEIRTNVKSGSYPLTAFSAVEIDEMVKANAPRERADVLLDFVRASLRDEQAGSDTFHSTPFFGSAWASNDRAVRAYAMAELTDGAPRDLLIASLLLSSDTDLNTRSNALDYIAKQTGSEPRRLLLGALDNSYRSVQVQAAGLVASKKIITAEPGLRQLLASPSRKVRAAAVAALQALGHTVPLPPQPPLDIAARALAATLWQRGLNPDDFLKSHQLMQINLPLVDHFDRATVAKMASAYAVSPERNQPVSPWTRDLAPPQFVLAAALRFGDDDSARLAYAQTSDQFETNEAAANAALEELAWNRYAEGLDLFHRKQDAASLPYLAQVIAFADVVKPFTRLSVYIQQSRQLMAYINSTTPEVSIPEPAAADIKSYVKYWIAQLKDCDGVRPSQAGEKIRQVGLPALPILIDAIPDQTPTRNFYYWRSYLPDRDFIYVGDAAATIIGVIGDDYGLSAPVPLRNQIRKPSELQRRLRDWLKTVPADAKLRPPGKRDRPLLHPAGEYYWGDD